MISKYAPPALKAYMARIGAKQSNFLRWKIEEDAGDGYHR